MTSSKLATLAIRPPRSITMLRERSDSKESPPGRRSNSRSTGAEAASMRRTLVSEDTSRGRAPRQWPSCPIFRRLAGVSRIRRSRSWVVTGEPCRTAATLPTTRASSLVCSRAARTSSTKDSSEDADTGTNLTQEESPSRTKGTLQTGQDQVEIARIHVRQQRLQAQFGRRQRIDGCVWIGLGPSRHLLRHGESVLQGREEFPPSPRPSRVPVQGTSRRHASPGEATRSACCRSRDGSGDRWWLHPR